jgi:hypothetical protein
MQTASTRTWSWTENRLRLVGEPAVSGDDFVLVALAPDEDGIEQPVLLDASGQLLERVRIHVVAQLVRAVLQLLERNFGDASFATRLRLCTASASVGLLFRHRRFRQRRLRSQLLNELHHQRVLFCAVLGSVSCHGRPPRSRGTLPSNASTAKQLARRASHVRRVARVCKLHSCKSNRPFRTRLTWSSGNSRGRGSLRVGRGIWAKIMRARMQYSSGSPTKGTR